MLWYFAGTQKIKGTKKYVSYNSAGSASLVTLSIRMQSHFRQQETWHHIGKLNTLSLSDEKLHLHTAMTNNNEQQASTVTQNKCMFKCFIALSYFDTKVAVCKFKIYETCVLYSRYAFTVRGTTIITNGEQYLHYQVSHFMET
jgi:hypothetical protein